MWWYSCIIYIKEMILSLVVTGFSHYVTWRWGRIKSWISVCVCFHIHVYTSFSVQHLCWLRLSRQWLSCCVGGTWCCPSQGSVISERRWCLLDWPADNTETRCPAWQVSICTQHFSTLVAKVYRLMLNYLLQYMKYSVFVISGLNAITSGCLLFWGVSHGK